MIDKTKVTDADKLRKQDRGETVDVSLANKSNPERLYAEWYDLETACQLKGISKKTAQNQRCLQPRGGEQYRMVGRRKRWHREIIAEWLIQTDEDLIEEESA